ncbi:hypothetical protein B9Z55_003083 [Caenorhabditis nigoni]|uniref:Uncharacterized protein n=1 Tax=Caenorhabditis nigoni TaxID=1611254 RepID=A0A2G5VNG6_9PELO|nr:hypothetical protein B9Z55_003083 [Caenorhabditis nigoni]
MSSNSVLGTQTPEVWCQRTQNIRFDDREYFLQFVYGRYLGAASLNSTYSVETQRDFSINEKTHLLTNRLFINVTGSCIDAYKKK